MKTNTYLAVYPTLEATEAAVIQLQNTGFDMARLSIVGSPRGTPMQMVSCYNTGSGVQYFGEHGASWTRLSTPMHGWGTFWSPGIRPLVVMGPLVQAIVTGQEMESTVTGMSDFAAGLCAIGIPADSIVQYEEALTRSKWLLFVNGAVNEIDRAHYALMETNPINGTLHHGADSESDEKQEKG